MRNQDIYINPASPTTSKIPLSFLFFLFLTSLEKFHHQILDFSAFSQSKHVFSSCKIPYRTLLTYNIPSFSKHDVIHHYLAYPSLGGRKQWKSLSLLDNVPQTSGVFDKVSMVQVVA